MDSDDNYEETEVARAATVGDAAYPVADDGGVQVRPGYRPAEGAEEVTTALDENGNVVVTMTYAELNRRLMQAYQDGFQKGEEDGYDRGVACQQASESEKQDDDDEEEVEDADEEEVEDGEAGEYEEDGEAEADRYEEGGEGSAKAKGKTFFADEFENEAKDEDCDEGGDGEAEDYDEGGEGEAEGYDEGGEGEAEGYDEGGEGEAEGYDEGGEGEAEGYDEGEEGEAEGYDDGGEGEAAGYEEVAEAEAECHDEAGSKDEHGAGGAFEESKKKPEKGAASSLAVAQAIAMASAQKRKVLCELGVYLDSIVAELQTSEDATEQPVVASRFQASDQECPAGRALRRLNRLRLRHSGCRPLARSDTSSVFAAHLAEDYASREEMFGVMPDLQEQIDACTVAVHNYEAKGREYGVAVYRSTTRADCDLQALALASIEYWYNGGEFFDFDNRHESMSQTRCRQFAQLIDTRSQRMGWGGVVLGIFAYAVAIFDNPIVQDYEAVGKLSPPIPGVDAN